MCRALVWHTVTLADHVSLVAEPLFTLYRPDGAMDQVRQRDSGDEAPAVPLRQMWKIHENPRSVENPWKSTICRKSMKILHVDRYL